MHIHQGTSPSLFQLKILKERAFTKESTGCPNKKPTET